MKKYKNIILILAAVAVTLAAFIFAPVSYTHLTLPTTPYV